MSFLRHTQSFYSDLSLETLTATLRFDPIGDGAFSHHLYAEAEDGFILKPKDNHFSNRSNFAPVVVATPSQEGEHTRLTLHLTPPISITAFWVLLFIFSVFVFAFVFPDIVKNPALLLIFPFAVLFFLSFITLSCKRTYRKTLKQFTAQLQLHPIQE